MRGIGVRLGAGLLALAFSACAATTPVPTSPSYDDIEQAVNDVGLKICASSMELDGIASLALDSRVFQVSTDCSASKFSQIVVDRFATTADRDSAADQFRVLTRPRPSGAVWVYGPFTVFAHGRTEDEVMHRLTEAMARLGAA